MNHLRVVKFCISGGLATGVHWLGITIATKIGLGINLAFACGFLIAVSFRFFIDRNFVFNKTQSNKYLQFTRYFVACLVTYGFSAICFGTLVSLHYHEVWQNFAITILLTTLIGYVFVNRALDGVSADRGTKQITALGKPSL